MNEHLEASPNAILFLKDFERGPNDGSVELSSGGAALTAYPCKPGGELTIGYGCLRWFDGDDVNLSHRLSGEEEAEKLLLNQLQPYVVAVRGMLEREATQSQFDGMICKAFNIGIEAFRDSSILKSFNEGRIEDAAANFGKWTGATCTTAPKEQREDPNYSDKIRYDHKGVARWVGPDGRDCAYMLRIDGLLYRCYAESLLFMGRHWSKTLRAPGHMKLELEADHPSRAIWNSRRGRWEDGVKFRTPFKDVYAAAYDDFLPQPELVLSQPLRPTVAPEAVGSAAGVPPNPTPAASSAPKVSPAPPVVQPQAKKPDVVSAPPAGPRPVPPQKPPEPPPKPVVIAPERINPNALPTNADTVKNMADSTRMIGMVLVAIGSVIQVITLRLGIGTAIGAVFFDLSRDPVVITLTVTAIVATFGWVTKRNGKKTFAKGADKAQGSVY